MKDVLESLGNRVDQMKERISDIEARNLKMTRVKGEKMKSKKKNIKLCKNYMTLLERAI